MFEHTYLSFLESFTENVKKFELKKKTKQKKKKKNKKQKKKKTKKNKQKKNTKNNNKKKKKERKKKTLFDWIRFTGQLKVWTSYSFFICYSRYLRYQKLWKCMNAPAV